MDLSPVHIPLFTASRSERRRIRGVSSFVARCNSSLLGHHIAPLVIRRHPALQSPPAQSLYPVHWPSLPSKTTVSPRHPSDAAGGKQLGRDQARVRSVKSELTTGVCRQDCLQALQHLFSNDLVRQVMRNPNSTATLLCTTPHAILHPSTTRSSIRRILLAGEKRALQGHRPLGQGGELTP